MKKKTEKEDLTSRLLSIALSGGGKKSENKPDIVLPKTSSLNTNTFFNSIIGIHQSAKDKKHHPIVDDPTQSKFIGIYTKQPKEIITSNFHRERAKLGVEDSKKKKMIELAEFMQRL